jgi:chromosome segregation ATPase
MLDIFQCTAKLSEIIGSVTDSSDVDLETLIKNMKEIDESLISISSSQKSANDEISTLKSQIEQFSSLKENFTAELKGKIELLFDSDESMKQSKLAILKDSGTDIKKLVDLGTEINSLFREKWQTTPKPPDIVTKNIDSNLYLSGGK